MIPQRRTLIHTSAESKPYESLEGNQKVMRIASNRTRSGAAQTPHTTLTLNAIEACNIKVNTPESLLLLAGTERCMI